MTDRKPGDPIFTSELTTPPEDTTHRPVTLNENVVEPGRVTINSPGGSPSQQAQEELEPLPTTSVTPAPTTPETPTESTTAVPHS